MSEPLHEKLSRVRAPRQVPLTFFRPRDSGEIAAALPFDVLVIGKASNLTAPPALPVVMDRDNFPEVVDTFVGDRAEDAPLSPFWSSVNQLVQTTETSCYLHLAVTSLSCQEFVSDL